MTDRAPGPTRPARTTQRTPPIGPREWDEVIATDVAVAAVDL